MTGNSSWYRDVEKIVSCSKVESASCHQWRHVGTELHSNKNLQFL